MALHSEVGIAYCRFRANVVAIGRGYIVGNMPIHLRVIPSRGKFSFVWLIPSPGMTVVRNNNDNWAYPLSP